MSTTTNGARRSTQDLREELARTRIESRLQQAKIEQRLLESWSYPYQSMTGGYGELVDPMDRYRDGDRLVVPMGLQARTDGRNLPFLLTEQELADIRGFARLLDTFNPLAIGAMDTLTSFVLGEGMMFRATSKDQAGSALVARLQDVIDGFVDANEFGELQQELFRASRVDGEYFVRDFWDDARQTTILRAVEPEQVTENGCPGGLDDGWTLGVQHYLERDDQGSKVREDVQTHTAYWVRYATDDPGEVVEASEIDHVKVNVRRSVKRGISDFVATGEAFEGVRKLIRNMREGAAVQAAIAGIREHSAEKAKVEGFQDAVRTQLTHQNPATGRSQKYQKYEPGTILDVGKGQTYKPPPWMSQGAPNQTVVIQAALRAIGVRWNLAEFMISGDASNANYASILVAGSQPSRWFRRQQAFYKARFLRLVWRAVRNAIRHGLLPPEALDLCEIQAEAPSPEIADDLKDAQVDQIDMTAGVLSRQTRRQRRGLDDEQERVNLKQEPPAVMGLGPGLPVQAPAPGQPAAPAAAGGKPPDTVDQAKSSEAGANALRASIGGSQTLAGLQKDYYAGGLPRTAAVANARLMFGFSGEEAEQLFPVEAPVKLTPEEPAAAEPEPEPEPPQPVQEGRRSFFPRLRS